MWLSRSKFGRLDSRTAAELGYSFGNPEAHASRVVSGFCGYHVDAHMQFLGFEEFIFMSCIYDVQLFIVFALLTHLTLKDTA